MYLGDELSVGVVVFGGGDVIGGLIVVGAQGADSKVGGSILGEDPERRVGC